MEKITTYKATGLVYGNYWGGGAGSYNARTLCGDDYDKLIEKIEESIKDGSLDAGMGYESLKGAMMQIETITDVLIEGKTYSNRASEIVFLGDLTDDEVEFLENVYLYL